MSTHSCPLTKVLSVRDHPNADRLSIVEVLGYQCITGKLEDGSHRYKEGDYVVYIPEDSILDEDLLCVMGFWNEEKKIGMLSGSKGNRVKIIKLRGEISQGILYGNVYKESNDVIKLTIPLGLNYYMSDGEDASNFLNITKREVIVPAQMRGQLSGNMRGYTRKYDIENIQRYTDVFKDGEDVVILEKIHGTNVQIGILSGDKFNGKPQIESLLDNGDIIKLGNRDVYVYVTSKGLGSRGVVQLNVPNNHDNIYVKTLNELFIDTGIIDRMLGDGDQTDIMIYIFGEIYGAGIQDLSYGEQSPQVRVFDVLYNNIDSTGSTESFSSWFELEEMKEEFGMPIVDALYKGPYSKEVAIEHRDGKTVTGNGTCIREGVVIRPLFKERNDVRGLPGNRAQLKFVSPDYLLRKNATEYY